MKLPASGTGVLPRLIGCFDSEGQFNYAVHVSEALGFIYFDQPVAACTTVKLNLNAWEAAARGIPYRNRTSREIHTRDLNPLRRPWDVGYGTFAEMLSRRDVLKLTSWRHPRDRIISAYLKKIRRPSVQGERFAEAFAIPAQSSFEEFVRLLASNEKAFMFDPHWRPQVVNAAVEVLQLDRVLLVPHLAENLSELSLELFAERRGIQDAREANPRSASGQNKSPELPAMIAAYDRHASRLYAEDLAYYERAVLSRERRSSVAPKE